MTWHALATYNAAHGKAPALVLQSDSEAQLFDLEDVYSALRGSSSMPNWASDGVLAALGSWMTAAAELASLAGDAASATELSPVPDGLALLAAPIMPPRVFAAASNYVEHAKEMGTVLAAKADSNPYMFIKASTAVIGPGETVVIPKQTEQADWEVELAAVIGTTARHVSVDDALNCVAGYTILNDVSARDLTRRQDYPFKFDWFQGKSFDTFAPLGPWIVPAGLIGDPQSLSLGLSVNGKQMQDGTAAEMIFTVAEQIAYLSSILTLQPGDVIATGTPTGVGKSMGIFLKPGDVMRATIEKIGALENPVAADPTA